MTKCGQTAKSTATLSDWIKRARSAERAGDFVAAYDVATRGLIEYPDSIDLRYLATRSLARSGSTEQAASLYERFGLDNQDTLDIVALGARIAKDRALSTSSKRRAALRDAAAAYVRIYVRTGDHYPAVNAATLYLLAKDHACAQAYARRALDASAEDSGESSLDHYYRLVTQAEAALICRDVQMAYQALQKASSYLDKDFDAAATTRRQLRLVCEATGSSPAIVDVIRPPDVFCYSRPMVPSHDDIDPASQEEFVNRLACQLSERKIGYAYGSLAAGSDILCAEASLRAKVVLNVILPFTENEFVKEAVRTAGLTWVRRFRECLDHAKSVTFATTDSYQDDDSLFIYGHQLALGMAILRAHHLDTAIWHLNGQRDHENRVTAGATSLQLKQVQTKDVASLTELKAQTVLERPKLPEKRTPPRSLQALIFGDVAGFSRTPDYLIPVFHKSFMRTIAAVLRRYSRHVQYRNTWGDAIYVVLDDPIAAANCCLDIQRAITKARPTRHGLSSELALRLAAHFGPVYEGRDFIRDEPSFFGAHATLAARLEPVTPPGQVYVTEAMAAAIATTGAPHLHLAYVGRLPLAKNFGSIRMYYVSRPK